MTGSLFSTADYEALGRYRSLLQQLPMQMSAVTNDLALQSDPQFMRLHQAALDNTLLQASAQLQNWPAQLDWPNGVFYRLIDIDKDIQLFTGQLIPAVDSMNRQQRQQPLATLDLDKLPFMLNGRLKLLSVRPALAFAKDIKQHLDTTWLDLDRTAFALEALHTQTYIVIARIIDFLGGAIDSYARRKNLQPAHPDAMITAIRNMIEKLRVDDRATTAAAMKLSEDYARLESLMEGAIRTLVNLPSTITINTFKDNMEMLSPSLTEAKALLPVK